jgi:hypothetical protein
MEVEKDIFDKFLSLSREQQAELLETIGFTLMEADEYCGKIIAADKWLDPEPYDVERFVEETLDDPATRLAEYTKTKVLTADEQRSFQDYVIEEALSNEYHPGLFLGSISCGDKKLVVVTERTGGAWDCEADLAGVFRNIEEAIRELSSTGAVHMLD